MAEATFPRSISVPAISSRAVEWALAHKAALALLSLMTIAGALRLWGLGGMALHHDESLHAQFSWYLYDGRGYQHDPLMHGPFQFHGVAAIYFLFGDTDFTARLLPAIFGITLVGMPWFLRKQIGMPAVLIAALLLTFSPTLLYFSRFLRNDIYLAVFSFAMVICAWRYLDERKPRFLYLLAAFLALGFATKEVTFITVAIFLVFMNLMLAIELGRRRDGEEIGDAGVVGRTLLLLPFAWVVAATWPLLGNRPFGRAALPPAGDVLVLMGTLSLPMFGAAVQVLPFVENDGYFADSEATLRVGTTLILIAVAAYIGLLWRPRTWLLAAAAFYVPFVLLYTTFFTNQPAVWTSDFWHGEGGFFTGIWGSLDYWLDQHHVQRGDQPVYYYSILTPLYEFLPLLLTLGGAFWLLRRGDSLRRWTLFWLAGTFVGLSLAGEKMPWLETHIALPLAIAGAIVLAHLIELLEMDARRWAAAAAAGLVTAVAVLLILEGGSREAALAGVVVLASLIGWGIGSSVKGGWREPARSLGTIALAALFVLTVRSSITVAFEHDDTPVEMLVYTQTSPDIPVLVDRIETLASETGLGYNLPIVVDTTDGYAWPWAWYLRDYHDVAYVDDVADYEAPEGAILLVHANNAARVDSLGYTQTSYKHRWWFDEDYKRIERSADWKALTSLDTYTGLKFARIATALGNAIPGLDDLESWLDFFINRRPVEGNTGSTDGVAFFPESLAAFDAGRVAQPPPEPTLLDDGRIIFGRPGLGEGEMLQAADVAVDGAGNIWIADARANRLQVFDASGRFVQSFGRGGNQRGTLNQPWSLTIDDEGFIYVADTWNHRIQKFSPEFELVDAWGSPTGSSQPGLLEYYGPRDVVIAADGTLWLTDTGHKRLVNLSRDGEPLGSLGGPGAEPGQFDEPVGLALAPDGRLVVADTWNARLQIIDPATGQSEQVVMPWSSEAVSDKPYVAVLSDGRIVASVPEDGTLLLIGADGQRLGTWLPAAGGHPLGIAALPDGGFVFSDSARNEVQIVPGSLVDSLFGR